MTDKGSTSRSPLTPPYKIKHVSPADKGEGFKRFHSFRLKAERLLHKTTIELDGKPLRGVRSFSVGACAGEVVEVMVTFLSDDIDVDVTDGYVLAEKLEGDEP